MHTHTHTHRGLADPFWRIDGTYLHPRDIIYAHIHGSPFSVEIAPFAPSGAERAAGRGGSKKERGGSKREADEGVLDVLGRAGGGAWGGLGGPWAPYLEGNLGVCSRQQALASQGRWVDRKEKISEVSVLVYLLYTHTMY
jgi:hypothetical protein